MTPDGPLLEGWWEGHPDLVEGPEDLPSDVDVEERAAPPHRSHRWYEVAAYQVGSRVVPPENDPPKVSPPAALPEADSGFEGFAALQQQHDGRSTVVQLLDAGEKRREAVRQGEPHAAGHDVVLRDEDVAVAELVSPGESSRVSRATAFDAPSVLYAGDALDDEVFGVGEGHGGAVLLPALHVFLQVDVEHVEPSIQGGEVRGSALAQHAQHAEDENGQDRADAAEGPASHLALMYAASGSSPHQ